MIPLIDRFVRDFPHLFRNGVPPCGLDVGVGWEQLLRELCENLENELPRDHDLQVIQIKEKFGDLRFYTFSETIDGELDTRIQRLISLAESRSGGICETCGAFGKKTTGRFGQGIVLCPKHEEMSKVRLDGSRARPPSARLEDIDNPKLNTPPKSEGT